MKIRYFLLSIVVPSLFMVASNSCKSRSSVTKGAGIDLLRTQAPIDQEISWNGGRFCRISEYSVSGSDATRHLRIYEKSSDLSSLIISLDKNDRLKTIYWSSKDKLNGAVIQQAFALGANGEIVEVGKERTDSPVTDK